MNQQNSNVQLIAGPPRSGKTQAAYEALLEATRQYGQPHVAMIVSNRHIARTLSDRYIAHIGVSSLSRPVMTMNAFAFRLLTQANPDNPPRLLNGAQQDAVLRQVLAQHVQEARVGDSCSTCQLLRDYFENDVWADIVEDNPLTTTDVLFEHGMNNEFSDQLRDMLARIDECGLHQSQQQQFLAAIADDGLTTDRLRIQWRLAFALRSEYIAAVQEQFQDEQRLDSSRLMVQSAKVARTIKQCYLPQALIVDDVQDLTLAGLTLLKTLHARGVSLTLAGNPDEAVQSFRGSYPDYVFRVLIDECDARLSELSHTIEHPTYKDIVASRVSLSIQSEECEPQAIPNRPGKMASIYDSQSLAPLSQEQWNTVDTTTCQGKLYRSSREQIDDVVWQIKQHVLDAHGSWNDCGVILHDNDAIRSLGERLRHDGVPVRFSSVTRPLIEEPFVEGLFALIELAQLHNRGASNYAMDLSALARFIRSRIRALSLSPLVQTQYTQDIPLRIEQIDSALQALTILAQVEDTSENTALNSLEQSWEALRSQLVEAQQQVSQEHVVDDALVHCHDDAMPFGIDAMYIMLAFGQGQAILDAVKRMMGTRFTVNNKDEQHQALSTTGNPQVTMFTRIFRLIDELATKLNALPSQDPAYALMAAWNVCNVAKRWQEQALENTDAGRMANDRLDTAMRLFEYVQTGAGAHSIGEFIDQVRQLNIEADSLAAVAPVDQAVTLTTPAGAASMNCKLVWMPSVQEGVWPNLAPRNTLFGGEDLVDVAIHGQLADIRAAASAHSDPMLAQVLAAEQRSFLYALTRADQAVFVSAVLDDDSAPSDFLYTYMPEVFNREQPQYADVNYQVLETDIHGLIARARITLIDASSTPQQREDAMQTLALLARHDVQAADPQYWSFIHTAPHDDTSEERTNDAILLSPSQVDAIWACPICWKLEKIYGGPQKSSGILNFGTLIHQVAQIATEQHWDDPKEHLTCEEITERMWKQYEQLRGTNNETDDPEESYRVRNREAQARTMIEHIANYYVASNESQYLPASSQFSVGTYNSVDVEHSFDATFSLSDITNAYNAIDGIDPVNDQQMCDLLGTLVGGWPNTMHKDLAVHLTGRIDRLEHRVDAHGNPMLRIIDYKTGKKRSKSLQFNDLQLVCYQLGLHFGASGDQLPPIAQSALFFVKDNDVPAQYGNKGGNYSPEAFFQEPLFTGRAINTGIFTPRAYQKAMLFSLDALIKPDTIDESTWQQFIGLRGTLALWSLTMIARVFYTAAASIANELEATAQPEHAMYCSYKDVCVACNREIDTVYGRVSQA